MVDWRGLDWRGVTPRPTAATPGDPGSGGTLDPADEAWLRPTRRSRRRTALLVGLAVVAVIVGLAVVAVIVGLAVVAYRRFQR
jgi:hypothetical protein